MFMHASIIQLVGNMLFLWLFGNNGRGLRWDRPGSSASTWWAAWPPWLCRWRSAPKPPMPTVGAAGAIAAVLGGYMVLYPRGKVLTVVLIPFLFTVIEVPVAGDARRCGSPSRRCSRPSG